MIGYTELFEILRKEKYSEALQPLPSKFLVDIKEYFSENSKSVSSNAELFTDSIAKSKKQLENAVSIFKELMLKRKKKILNLVFVATETGIMKKDYENMLSIEKEIFDSLVHAFEKGDKEISRILKGEVERKESDKMVIFKQDVDQFVDHTGKLIGPFKEKELANLNPEVAKIFVDGDKAYLVDEP